MLCPEDEYLKFLWFSLTWNKEKAKTLKKNCFSPHEHWAFKSKISTGGMNTIFSWCIPSFGVLIVVVNNTVWHGISKHPIDVQLGWDLVTVKSTPYEPCHFHHSVTPCALRMVADCFLQDRSIDLMIGWRWSLRTNFVLVCSDVSLGNKIPQKNKPPG